MYVFIRRLLCSKSKKSKILGVLSAKIINSNVFFFNSLLEQNHEFNELNSNEIEFGFENQTRFASGSIRLLK